MKMSDLPIIIATIISILVFQLYCGWDKIPEISNIECCEKFSFDLIYLLNMIIHFFQVVQKMMLEQN
jgi:hypothetical protein